MYGRYDYGDGNEHGEHGGQRGRALGALRVDEGGAGGVGGVSRRLAAHPARLRDRVGLAARERAVAVVCAPLRARVAASVARDGRDTAACAGRSVELSWDRSFGVSMLVARSGVDGAIEDRSRPRAHRPVLCFVCGDCMRSNNQ